jgi:hypothetical protein
MSSEGTIFEKADIKKYLEEIGITEPAIDRLKELYQHIQRIFPCDIQDVFVIDYFNQEGKRIYEDVDFYTSDFFVISLLGFLNRTNIRISSIEKRVTAFDISAKDYDFQKATSESRLQIKCVLDSPYFSVCDFKAAKENCDYLMKIISKYFRPNLRK